MLYDTFMRKKLRNLGTYKTAVGYPCAFAAGSAQPLQDYRIYGNTIDGAHVGDKTKNLFDINGQRTDYRCTSSVSDGVLTVQSSDALQTLYSTQLFQCTQNTDYTISMQCNLDDVPLGVTSCIQIWSGRTGGTLLGNFYTTYSSGAKRPDVSLTFNSGDFTEVYIWFFIRQQYVEQAQDFYISYWDIQLEEGTQKTDYDQYGYKIPLENNGTAFETLYLPEPLPQGAYAEYGTQRIRRADGGLIPAALPQLTAHAGANSITAGTTVPPTTISVKYK